MENTESRAALGRLRRLAENPNLSEREVLIVRECAATVARTLDEIGRLTLQVRSLESRVGG